MFEIEEQRAENLNRTSSDALHGRRLAEFNTLQEDEVKESISREMSSGGLETSGDEPQISLSETVSKLTLKAPFLDTWDGSYEAKLDFTEHNPLYEATAGDRENLGGERLVSPNFEFTRPGRYRFRIFANDQIIHIHGELELKAPHFYFIPSVLPFTSESARCERRHEELAVKIPANLHCVIPCLFRSFVSKSRSIVRLEN